MICYWETSQRPLIIRTVWIKGHRHAILSDNDLVNKNQKKKEEKQKVSNLSIEVGIGPDYHITSSQQDIHQRMTKNNSNSLDNKMNINCDSALHSKINNMEPNPLSERVLQWLDLAGQASTKYVVESKYANLSTVRRSLPEVKVSQNEFKLLKQDIEFEENKSSDENQKTKKIINFDKYKISSSTKPLKGFKKGEVIESRPTSNISEYSLCDSDEDELSIEEELVPKKIIPKENYEFEHNYINIIKKQIFESSCNTYVARKKLHIFIPSLPKKPASSIDNGSNVSTNTQKN